MAVYSRGDMLTLKSGAVWQVREMLERDGRTTVGLDDPTNPGKHGTAFFADVLDTLVTQHRPATDVASGRDLAHDLYVTGACSTIRQAQSIAPLLQMRGWTKVPDDPIGPMPPVDTVTSGGITRSVKVHGTVTGRLPCGNPTCAACQP